MYLPETREFKNVTDIKFDESRKGVELFKVDKKIEDRAEDRFAEDRNDVDDDALKIIEDSEES